MLLSASLTLLVFGVIPGSVPPPGVAPHAALPPPTPLGKAEMRVTSSAGESLAGATVRAIRVAAEGSQVVTSLSDSDGVARFAGLPGGEYWFVADADGYARASTALVLDGGLRSRTLSLSPEHRLSVAVTDDQGAPLVGAEVEVLGESNDLGPLPVGARTQAGGLIEVGHLGHGPWAVTARAEGFEEVTRRHLAGDATVSIILKRLGALFVSVVSEAHAPVAGATIQIAGPRGPLRGGTTEDSGDVALRGLEAGTYSLRALAKNQVSNVELGIALLRGEERRLTLVLHAGRSLEVRVTEGEGESAKGVRGARVSLAEGGLSPFPLEGVTGATGGLTLGPFSLGFASISVQADGFVPRGPISVPVDQSTLRVPLSRAGTLIGRVISSRGFPIGGATLEVIGTALDGTPIDDDPRLTSFRAAHFDAHLAAASPSPASPAPLGLPNQVPLIHRGELGVVPGAPPPIPHGFALPLVAMPPPTAVAVTTPWVTRADGTFRLSPVSPGRIYALVRHPEYVQGESEEVTLAPSGEATVEIVMHQGGRLEGRVVDSEGRPVTAVHILATAVRGAFERTTRAATDGTFAFASLPDGVTLTVVSDESFEALLRVEVAIPERAHREITLTLPAARPALPVHVKDDRGYPIEGAQLSLSSKDPKVPLRTTSFSDRYGDAHLRSARGLPVRIEASADGFSPTVVHVAEGAGQVEIELLPGETLTGSVVEKQRGDAIVGALVKLESQHMIRKTQTAKGGLYAFKNLPVGPVSLSVEAAGYAPFSQVLTLTSRRSGSVTEIAPMLLSHEGRVSGEVLGPRGDPVVGARVARDHAPTFVVVGAPPEAFAVTDAHGRFTLGQLPEGELTLEAYSAEHGRGEVSGVRVIEGETRADVVIRIDDKEAASARTPRATAGVAMTLGERGGDVVVVSVAPGSEAERVGIVAGDVLEAVDGVRVTTTGDARQRLSGAQGDEVLLRVKHVDGEDTLRVARELIRR